MVKDDLAAFQAAIAAYEYASRYEAIKQFFSRVPNPIFHGFWFTLGVVVVFAVALACVLFTLVDKGQKDLLLYTIMGILTAMMMLYFYLLKRYGLDDQIFDTYRGMLTPAYYQVERYLLFKERLTEKYSQATFPCESVKSQIQYRLQLNEGLSVIKNWLLGVSASVIITILYGLTPSDETAKLVYIAVISFLLILILFYAYFVHDPFWFKNNKLREMLLFISIYESEPSINDVVPRD